MAKFSIAFIAPTEESMLKHCVMEGADKESVLKEFFAKEVSSFYSNDEQGYHYFKEDFLDAKTATGSIIGLE